jgi:hypothetical protein
MATISIPQYLTREVPKPGDRISNNEGRYGTVIDVRTENREIEYGEVAVKWDEGVVVIHHSRAEEFALISRAQRTTA